MRTKKTQHAASREEAGRELANRLSKYSTNRDVIVLALSNGGVPVGAEVAALLHKPFDILFVEEITTPSGEILLGAITGGGVRMLNGEMIDRLQLSQAEISTAVLEGSMKIAHREKLCRGERPKLEIADHTVILIDDGTSPCATIRDAIRLLRRQHADRIIVALPAACRRTTCDLRLEADEVVALVEPAAARPARKRVMQFPRITDDEVRHFLSGRCLVAGVGN